MKLTKVSAATTGVIFFLGDFLFLEVQLPVTHHLTSPHRYPRTAKLTANYVLMFLNKLELKYTYYP